MAGTVPADVAQSFGFMIRVTQKLAYLYGFPDFELDEENLSDETLDQLMLFIGVMFGVNGAVKGINFLAKAAAEKTLKTLARKALTKGTIYPIVKKIAQAVGVKMTKQIFAKGVSKVIPVLDGFMSGGLTYMTFKPCAKRLKKSLSALPISDPEFYKNPNAEDEIVDDFFTDINEDDIAEDIADAEDTDVVH